MSTEAGNGGSIFADEAQKMYSWYEAEIRFHDKVMGGAPKNPKIIEGWLRSKTGVTDDEEIRMMTMRTLSEMGIETSSEMSFEDLMKASESVAAERNTNGFKQDENGLFVESRQVKAMLKECVNILFAGERWGRTKKGPLNFTAERVFVEPRRIYLDRQAPDGIDMFIGHVTGPQGPRSTLGYYEYCERPILTFQVGSLQDQISQEQWPQIWVQAEKVGFGAVRSQGYGTFDVTRWDRINESTRIKDLENDAAVTRAPARAKEPEEAEEASERAGTGRGWKNR